MRGDTDSESEWVNKYNTVASSCCSKRLFCDIYCFMIFICDNVSQFNGGAKRCHLKYHYLPINPLQPGVAYPTNSILWVIICIYNVHVSDKDFFPPSNHFYDNWKIAFFLFPWQPQLGRQCANFSLSKLTLWRDFKTLQWLSVAWLQMIDSFSSKSNSVKLLYEELIIVSWNPSRYAV